MASGDAEPCRVTKPNPRCGVPPANSMGFKDSVGNGEKKAVKAASTMLALADLGTPPTNNLKLSDGPCSILCAQKASMLMKVASEAPRRTPTQTRTIQAG